MRQIPKFRYSFSIILLTLALHPAYSHDAFETTVVASLEPTSLEVEIIVSQRGANQLLAFVGASDLMIPGYADFETVKAVLNERAADLFYAFAGEETSPLPLVSSEVLPGDHGGEVEIHLTYASPGDENVYLDLAYLEQLGGGYYGRLTLMEGDRGTYVPLSSQNNPEINWNSATGRKSPQPEPEAPIVHAEDRGTKQDESPVAHSTAETIPAIDVAKDLDDASGTTGDKGNGLILAWGAIMACVAGVVLLWKRKN